MRRTFPLLATIAAEVAAVFGGAAPAVADTTAPSPVAVAQPEAARAAAAADASDPSATDPGADDPAADAPTDAPTDPAAPVPDEPAASAPSVTPEEPTFVVRTGRVGDPAAIATSLTDDSNRAADSSPMPSSSKRSSSTSGTRRVTESGATTSTRPQNKTAGRAQHSASTAATAPAEAPSASATPNAVSPATPSSVPTTTASTHVVVDGDNLWSIAASHVASATGRNVAALSTAEIVRYWVRVCDENRARLQSGNVSLIFAGEIVELPAI